MSFLILHPMLYVLQSFLRFVLLQKSITTKFYAIHFQLAVVKFYSNLLFLTKFSIL